MFPKILWWSARTHPTPRPSPLSRTVFTQRLVSDQFYEVNLAIAFWSPFLSIRKSKYQRDIASKIRTSHSIRSLSSTGYFLRWNRRRGIRTLVVVFELLEELVAWRCRNGKFNEQFQILLLELKVKFIWIAFVCISDGFKSTCFIYIGYASCWQVPRNGGQTWRLPKIR